MVNDALCEASSLHTFIISPLAINLQTLSVDQQVYPNPKQTKIRGFCPQAIYNLSK